MELVKICLNQVVENFNDFLVVVLFFYYYKYFENKLQIGLSAQEINKYYPEVVALAPFDSEYDESENKYISKTGENYLTLKYERLVVVSLQGIKELHKKIKI